MLDRSRRMSLKSRLLTYETTASTIKSKNKPEREEILTLRKNHSLTIKIKLDSLTPTPHNYIYQSPNKNYHSS